jgi:hypothetical protein
MAGIEPGAQAEGGGAALQGVRVPGTICTGGAGGEPQG